jgi:hypothetical protein
MLDGRFSTPVQKSIIYSDDPSNDTPEYDAIIIKLTCYIVAVNLQRASGNWEDAEVIQEQITNIEKTGMVDKLNKGEWKLSFETDSTDKKGDIIEVTKTGTMSCVETSGEWLGKKYDRLQVICTTAGAYGTAMVTIKYSNEDALYGFTKENVKITGGLDYFVNGLYVRFEGASMSVNDRWDIEVRNFAETNSNSGVRSIDAVRNDLQPQRVVTRDRTFD